MSIIKMLVGQQLSKPVAAQAPVQRQGFLNFQVAKFNGETGNVEAWLRLVEGRGR